MKTKKLLAALFTTLVGLAGEAYSQGIKIQGDTIFVNSDVEVEIKFPAPDVEGRWVDRNPPYVLSLATTSIFIHAKSDNVACSRLVVNEGKRDHSFVVCFKKNINQAVLKEVLYDYSTLKKIQQRVKEIEARDALKSVAHDELVEKNPKEPPAQRTSAGSSKPATSIPPTGTVSYYALLEQAEQYSKEGDLDKAERKYQEVLNSNPGNSFAIKGLSDLNEKKLAKERAKKQEEEDKINLMRKNATDNFYAKRYDEALEGYKKVLALVSNDEFSKKQINEIEKLKAEEVRKRELALERQLRKEAEDKIITLKAKGRKALNEKLYDDAILAYEEVLKLSQNDKVAQEQISAINKIKQQIKREAGRDEDYKAIVSAADKAFENKEYEVAKAGYLSAKEIKPNDAALAIKIKLTEEKIVEREKEDEYSTAITLGDVAKKSGDYEKAKAEFTKAFKIFKDKKYPLDQIAEVNTLINNANAALDLVKEKEAKERLANLKYQSAIEKGNKALLKDDLPGAKLAFAEALSIKAGEDYPKEKLIEIGNKEKERQLKAANIARVAELNKNYTAALQKGKTAFDKGDYKAAKIAYTLASELKPDEFEPRKQLELIDKKVSQGSVSAKFDSAMIRGNLAAADKNLRLALENYREALKLNPLDRTALAQLQYMQRMVTQDSIQEAETARRAEQKIRYEISRRKFDEGMAAYVNFENAAQTANYEDQLIHLKHFLNIIPDASVFDDGPHDAGKKIKFAKDKIERIRAELSRVKGKTYQAEAIPYLNQDLEKKYENLNFAAPPTEQIFEKDTTAANESKTLSTSLLAEKGHLSLGDSSNKVKITLQSIRFKGDKVYYNVRILNNATDEFLTGPMHLSRVTKGGSVNKSNPYYVSAFPIVLPGKEFSVLYATKSIEVKDNDTLLFELNDRLGKNRLKISIPGSVYNTEKSIKTDSAAK